MTVAIANPTRGGSICATQSNDVNPKFPFGVSQYSQMLQRTRKSRFSSQMPDVIMSTDAFLSYNPRTLFSPNLILSSRSTGVDELSVGVDDPLDQTFRFEMGNGASGKGSVDLHSVDEGGDGDNSVSWDLLHDSLAGD